MAGPLTSTGLNVRQGLIERGCLYLGTGDHFIGVGGMHLDGYCNVDPALPDTEFISAVSYDLVLPYADADVEGILVPAIGAIPLAQWGPHHLRELNGRKIPGVWADKKRDTNELVIVRNGFAKAIAGRRVLILEDMINQMHSAKQLIRIARGLGCYVVGVGSIAANSGASAEAMDVPQFDALCDVTYDTWTPEECADHGPCAEKRPIVLDEALGHGARHQAEHPDYPGGYVNLLAA